MLLSYRILNQDNENERKIGSNEFNCYIQVTEGFSYLKLVSTKQKIQ